MKKCIFCADEIRKGSNKAKEHVFRKSWLQKLGHLKAKVHLHRVSTQEGYLDTRELVADAVLTGEVCRHCNGGWMNQTDIDVEAVILSRATEEVPSIISDPSEKFLIARYMLKTACAFVATDEADRRHIPEFIYRNAPNRDYLPPGFIVFMDRTPRMPDRLLGVGSVDWWSISPTYIDNFRKSVRFKFGIQFGGLILGCAYLSMPFPRYHGIAGMHELLYINNAFYFDDSNSDFSASLSAFGPTPLNIALMALTADF